MCHTANFTERLQRGKRHSYVSRKKRRLHGNVSGSLGKSPWTWGGTISLSESHHEPQMQSPKDGDCSFPCVSALAPLRWPRSHARGPIDKKGSPTLLNLSPGRQSKRGSKRTTTENDKSKVHGPKRQDVWGAGNIQPEGAPGSAAPVLTRGTLRSREEGLRTQVLMLCPKPLPLCQDGGENCGLTGHLLNGTTVTR